VTSTGGGSFSSGEQHKSSDEEEPGVTTPEPGALHPSITPKNEEEGQGSSYSRAMDFCWTSQCSKKGISPQHLIESLSAQVKQRPLFLNVMSIVDNGTPLSSKEAMRSSKADQWKKATDNEYTAIINNNTSPVVCKENLRLVTGHAMLHCLDIHIVDVKNVFLQAEMEEDEMIYLTQPEGYVNSDHPNYTKQLSMATLKWNTNQLLQ